MQLTLFLIWMAILFLREIIILSTLDHSRWEKKFSFEGIHFGRMDESEIFSKKLIREVIGESIPPLGMAQLVKHLIALEEQL